MARPHVAVHFRRHLIVLAGAAAAFFVAFLIVDNNTVSISDWETDLTKWINGAPAWLAHVLWPIMQLGTVWGPMVIGIVVIYVYGWRRGVAVIVSGVVAWFLAKYVKDIVSRGRPLHFIPTIDVREGKGTGLGFVSGHTAVAFAIATALLPVLSLRGRVIAYSLASIVGIARHRVRRALPPRRGRWRGARHRVRLRGRPGDARDPGTESRARVMTADVVVTITDTYTAAPEPPTTTTTAPDVSGGGQGNGGGGSGDGSLPFTGSTPELLLWGLGTVVLGSAVTLGVRRRRAAARPS